MKAIARRPGKGTGKPERPAPISELSAAACRRLRVVATDIDDTLTDGGKLGPAATGALEALDEAGLYIILVTGRPAGYAMTLATYLPGITATIAENGGVMVSTEGVEFAEADGLEPDDLHERLEDCVEEIESRVTAARPTADGFARLTDRTFELEGLTPADRAAIAGIARGHGLVTASSSIHLHLKLACHDKGRALSALLGSCLDGYDSSDVVTVGDSATDESLFDAKSFPISAGVANITAVLPALKHRPAYVTSRAEGAGFRELVAHILKSRSD